MPTKLQRWLYWLTGVLAGIVILFVTSIALIPATTIWLATGWLEDRGVHSSIEDVSINLFNGQVRVSGFQAIGPNKKKINLSELFVFLNIKDLFDHKITIEKVEFSDFYIDVHQETGKTLRFGDIDFSQITDKQSTTDQDSTPWPVIIKDIGFRNFKTCYQLYSHEGKSLYNNCLALGSFSVDGQSSYIIDKKAGQKDLGLLANLSFVLKNITLHDNPDDADVVTIGTMKVNGLTLNGLNNIDVESININDLAVLELKSSDSATLNNKHVASVNSIAVTDLSILHTNNYLISDIAIDGLNTYLFRKKDGELGFSERIKKLFHPETVHQSKIDTTEPDPAIFKINNLSIQGDSKIAIKDDRVTPSYVGVARDISLQLSQIDSSDINNKSPILLSAIAGEHGKINFNGEIVLFAKRPTGNLKGSIQGVNAADFSAYLSDALHHNIKSGYMDADIALAVDQGKLDSTFNFIFHKFYLEESDQGTSKEYTEKLGIPLTQALKLLRNKDGSIYLKLPVTGDIESPEFSFKNTINKVILDSIKYAVINYYTPFGIVTLGTKVFNLATALRFEPIKFEAADTELDSSDTGQLDKLAILLNERPGVHLILCGQSTIADRITIFSIDSALMDKARKSAADEKTAITAIANLLPAASQSEITQLVNLAIQRGKNVRDYLSKNNGIDPSRLIMCNPTYTNDTQAPRVEISI
ncbi:DUF748 domain-containing protein [Sulfuriflexus mobilis]|uniref:DUF748 domain-containing protein n=1 Tax=Sulfuriflexus mobilis TaxID=1811807 RepID=UPI000F84BAF2|nr:DUF748 domain-containing protein [Sulfuriflexus mobilis]